MDQTKYHNYAKLKWPNPRTLANYMIQARRIEPLWTGNPPELTQETLDTYLAMLSKNKSYGNPLYYGFLRGYLECYRTDLEALGRDIVINKPSSRRETNRDHKFLDIEDINYILGNITDQRMILTISLMFDTGLRVSELQNLKTENIDFGNRTASGKGKGGKWFKVKFGPETRELLIAWLDKCPNRDRPFWFYSKGLNKPLKCQAQACYYYMRRATEKIGFHRIHPHRFRHALGYYLRKYARLDLAEIKEKLRHSSVTSTQIYAVATQEEVDRKIDKLVFKVDEEGSQ